MDIPPISDLSARLSGLRLTDLCSLLAELTDVSAIQPAYFRTGVGTHLRISARAWHRDDGLHASLVWTFCFMDFGMQHTIKGKKTLTESNGVIKIHNRVVRSPHHAECMIFAGKYKRFMRHLYRTLEVTYPDEAGPPAAGSLGSLASA
jgi:hypothetical protein